METSLILIFWFAQALIITLIGSKRKIGAFWSFLIAFLVGPLFGIIAILISKKKSDTDIVFPDLKPQKDVNRGMNKEMLKELVDLERMFKNKELDEATYMEAKKRIESKY